MASLFKLGTAIRGRFSTYSIVKELHRAADEGAVFLAINQDHKKCIFKSIRDNWRLQNEADILKRYQDQTPFLRPLLDEITGPSDPPSIVLKHLDSDLLTESNRKRLSRPETKQGAKCVLEALRVLHKDGLVHTDVKLDNIFVNYGQDQRFNAIQLGDCGGVVPEDSDFAKKGHLIGAGFTRSPEATFQLPWGTATDICLIYGGDYHLFNPGIEGLKPEDNVYELTVLKRTYKFFGPFPQSYDDFHDSETITIIKLYQPPRPAREAIMKLDPRDRPTAEQLLADEWFTEESEDTRDPLPEKPRAQDDAH
ncbi:hypothetical protein VTH82DRAFT_8410 [Thermothelomyces myriococcoides]